jgi:hypothetical protein
MINTNELINPINSRLSATLPQQDFVRIARHQSGIGWKRHGSNFPEADFLGV